jgi:hypothetical protein
MKPPDFLAPFVADRTAALRSLDAAHIRAYARKWGARLPAEDGPVFWASVHKARLSLSEFTPAEKDVSRAWLVEHGFAPKGLGEP